MSVPEFPVAASSPLPARGRLLRAPLPHLRGPVRRAVVRVASALLRPRVLEMRGLEHVEAARDPFVLALNHSQRLEAVTIPALLASLRGGRLVHFLADWNFMLIPGVAFVMRVGGTLPVVQKDAHPRFLNVFKPMYRGAVPVMTRARRLLEQGHSIGIYPEGRVNRDTQYLLRGNAGAARLALQACVPVVPAGIRFPTVAPGERIRDFSPMTIEFGAPLAPVPQGARRRPSQAAVQAHHDEVMSALARLSGKSRAERISNPSMEAIDDEGLDSTHQHASCRDVA
jgi:1-acyl-sn-glycerol-3-phosphate acyltransferase